MPTQYFDGSKPGPGRPKGSKTKRVYNTDTLMEAINANNYDPVVDMINIARDPKCPFSTRAKVGETFLKLIYPAQKAVEHSGSIETRSLSIQWNVGDTVAQPSVEALQADNSIPLTVDSLDIEKPARNAPSGSNDDDGIED